MIEKLSAPELKSFYQQEERDLIKLKFISKRLVEQKLNLHQQRYYWLLNSYHDTRVLPRSYFAKRLKKLSVSQAKQKLLDINKLIQLARNQKIKLVKKHHLDHKILKVAHRLSYCIWWQDLRKSYIFQANHIIDTLLRELSRRYQVSFTDLHWYNFAEILKLSSGGVMVSKSELANRKRYYLVNWRPNKGALYLSGKKARQIYEKYLFKSKIQKVTVFKGQAVSLGITRGRVRIILSPKQAGQMKLGEILVTTMTSPDFIVAMRKAAAIVTDVGGITSHAAIVSRELKIPCIVGTHIATHSLKNGDRVEVDANKGIVRKLKAN